MSPADGARPQPPAEEGKWKAGGLTPEAMQRAGELVTGRFAAPLIQAAGLPPAKVQDIVVLDNGAGSACVAADLLKMLDGEQKERTRIVCGDIQPGSLEFVSKRVKEEGWRGVEVKSIDTQDTKLPSASYTHVLSSFVLMLVPKPQQALAEIHRILVPGGVNAFTTWNTVGWLPWVQDAFAAIPGCPPFPPAEKRLNPAGTGRWDLPEVLREEVEKVGFVDVNVELREERPVMDNPEMYVRLFANMLLSLATKWFTDEEKKEYTDKIKQTLLKQLQEKFGEGKPFDMPMTANLVTCKKPSN
ncbi:S-adenosyl-L-methionine-dependent methyltransferase [Calocera cornea HHB12733]|uniref:S-adenosyl-L-methionine-dependent methyltransferase n=1 Tax=Calocera cornea HHB12733 TaxID=1353952 RepID=A0A165IIX9_9BASI|nr:S-adenosyl-L-methionine-dependent methyltransferase [Calocera cornea HHB12733]